MTRYRVRGRLAAAITLALLALVFGGSAAAAPGPDLGPNVIVFDPSMSTSQIQSAVDSIYAQQQSNQFGNERYALLFEPGTYGSAATPLKIPVGYYTDVAGLGASPNDVTINGAVDSFDQCDATHFCTALNNSGAPSRI